MVQQGQIDHLLQETGEIAPPGPLVAQATLQDFDAAYHESMESPEGFWEKVASELEWSLPVGQGLRVGLPDFSMVLGGAVQHHPELP